MVHGVILLWLRFEFYVMTEMLFLTSLQHLLIIVGMTCKFTFVDVGIYKTQRRIPKIVLVYCSCIKRLTWPI